MNLPKFLFLGTILFCYVACSKKMVPISQRLVGTQNIVIDSLRPGGFPPCEPTICIDPTNKQHILAGAVLDYVYESFDGGKTWKNDKLKSTYGVYGDPVIRIDNKGKAYYAHLSNPKGAAYASEEFLDRIVVQSKVANSNTWTDGSFPPADRKKDHDKHWYSFDPQDQTILMSWTEFDKYGSKEKSDKSRILFSKSSDGGNTWTNALDICAFEGDCIDDDFTTEGAVPTVDEQGNYHVVWSFNENIYINTSQDKGKTWLKEERLIQTQPIGWSYDIPGISRCNGMPFIDVDRSKKSKHYGRIFVNWSDQRNGTNDTDVWISYSDDYGKTWANPVRVNDDKTKTHQFMSSMDVDPKTGYVYVLFYDRRAYKDNNTDVTLAVSQNGGVSFENFPLSTSPFLPKVNGVFFGDYTDISAFDGSVRPIWTRQDGFKLKVLTSLIEIK